MMYPYMTFNDGTEITHSEMKPDGQVKVYIETPDLKDGFQNASNFQARPVPRASLLPRPWPWRSCMKNFIHAAAVHDNDITRISFTALQDIFDSAELRHAGKEHLLSFFKQIFSYAVTAGYLDKSPAVSLRINIPDDDEKGVPFTDSG